MWLILRVQENILQLQPTVAPAGYNAIK